MVFESVGGCRPSILIGAANPLLVIMPLPFVMAIAPVRASSRMPNARSIAEQRFYLAETGPVTSIMMVFGLASSTRALNIWAISNTS